MSRADKDCAMTEQDAVAADELKRFCQQLVHAAQFKSVRRFIAGSHVELPYNDLSMQRMWFEDGHGGRRLYVLFN